MGDNHPEPFQIEVVFGWVATEQVDDMEKALEVDSSVVDKDADTTVHPGWEVQQGLEAEPFVEF
jgi:hypothetical protein